jgi:tetratricopeptide (TPR) repeat protein
VAALLLQLGQAYETLGRLDEAVATFAQARAAAPDDLSADFAIVEAYRQAGRVDDAFEALRAARARFPDDSRLLRLEAQVLQQAGRVDEAAALLKQGGAADGRVTMVVALAQIYADAGRYDDAVAVLGDAERRSPGDVLLKFQRGAVLERRRDFEGAERAFRDALALDPSHAPTLNYLGYMLADRGEKLDEAVSLLGRAVAIDPENGSYLDSLGWAHFRRAEYAEAREYLARAASLLGRNSVVQDHYGDVLFKLDDREGAAAAWQRALDGDLQDVERAELERKLRQAREP